MSDIIVKGEKGILFASFPEEISEKIVWDFYWGLKEIITLPKEKKPVFLDMRNVTRIPDVDRVKIIANALKVNKYNITRCAVCTIEDKFMIMAFRIMLVFAGMDEVKIFTEKDEAIEYLIENIG